MKTKQALFTAFFALFTLSSAAFAQTPATGFLSDYGYQVANLSADQAQSLMDTETKNTAKSSICANRANLWSYIMNQQDNVQVGKVFIHFTSQGEATENKQWAYHVAPYVIVNGVEMVLDGGFGVFNHQPVALTDWENYFGKSPNCAVLDPTHNPDDLALEQNDLPNDQVNPITFTTGGARQYPVENGNICYLRKVPMYYVYPADVYGADLALSGQTQYNSFILDAFNPQVALDSCKQALGFFEAMKMNCSKYLGLSK